MKREAFFALFLTLVPRSLLRISHGNVCYALRRLDKRSSYPGNSVNDRNCEVGRETTVYAGVMFNLIILQQTKNCAWLFLWINMTSNLPTWFFSTSKNFPHTTIRIQFHHMRRENWCGAWRVLKIEEVMFPSTCLTILLSRCEDTNCTKRYLVKQPVQLLLRVEKDENKLCYEL